MRFRRRISPEPQGQITLASSGGRWIRFLASLPDVLSIVEIGTWLGGGSTECIRAGLLDRGVGGSCISIEVDASRAALAARRFADEARIQILHGRIVELAGLDDSNLTPQEIQWIDDDRRAMATAPDVMGMLPPQIDFLVLDGGEFSTYSEFEVLLNRRPRWIFLDDATTRKGRRLSRDLSEGKYGYVTVYSTPERNGVVVARLDEGGHR